MAIVRSLLSKCVVPAQLQPVTLLNRWNRHLSCVSKQTCCKTSPTCPAQCKVALITGGSIGIGYACAEALLKCGAKGVMLGSRRESLGEEAACKLNKKYGEKKAVYKRCDVTHPHELEALFECTMKTWNQLDIVINNAGLLQDKHWSLEVDVNVKGLIHGTLLGFKYMGKHEEHRGGVIVNMASVYGLQQAHGCPVYNGTKAFVVRFSNAMSHEYYESLTGVKVFVMCPGVTDTDMIDDSAKYGLEGFGCVGEILREELAALPSQPAEACGNCLLRMLCADENGSIWVIEDSECYKVALPDRQTLRVCECD